MLIFVSGGVRSGKSSFAERLATEQSDGAPVHYIATSKQDDAEMMERIEKHQLRRKKSAVDWITWEVPSRINRIEKRIEKGAVILLDCLTTWLNNELFADVDHLPEDEQRKKIKDSIVQTLTRLQEDRTLIVVSNEVFNDILPDHRSTMAYVEMLGTLHQTLVAMAEKAYLCENGVPVLMKGETVC